MTTENSAEDNNKFFCGCVWEPKNLGCCKEESFIIIEILYSCANIAVVLGLSMPETVFSDQRLYDQPLLPFINGFGALHFCIVILNIQHLCFTKSTQSIVFGNLLGLKFFIYNQRQAY
ncbi:hypothetical protein FGO68_gene13446 [Halteria grandinella]|uniref:Uncharacterized protein n=1 Tax=Halteria grandinella TaxID=5974 RepID=A0A8J8T1G7_HALGN|nr:hypothetical protein FGO68_gene13446 [Halteria grandinella]